ncbi:MAG TPA: GDSL-type esterase/lipase family protein [Planctomycetota bacterium]|jgi:lysophospholipase L1-like esterase
MSNRTQRVGIVAGFCLFATFAFAQDISVKSGEKIAFLGDSITAGGMGSPTGYCRLVISGLEANGVSAAPIGAGVSGHKSNQMLARLDHDVLSKKPEWMTLSCGVNDVWHGANGVPLDAYKKNITEIVDKAMAAGIKVVILTSTMIGEDQANPNNQKLVAYNDFLRELAKEKKCALADLNADMQETLKQMGANPKNNTLTGDGVHMNPLGDMMMAAGILKSFGLNEEQLKKARDKWLDTPNAMETVGKARISIRQFQQLNAYAAQQKRPLPELLNDAVAKAVESMLKQQ